MAAGAPVTLQGLHPGAPCGRPRGRVARTRRFFVQLSDLLTPQRIRVPLRGAGKDEVIRALVDALAETGAVTDADDVLRAVRAREEVLSTGIGNGVAIPHGRSDAAPGLTLAAGIVAQPVDFDAVDARPVSLVFLLVGPESAAGEHVKALSRVVRLVRRDDVRERLIAAATAEEFLAIVAEAEAA